MKSGAERGISFIANLVAIAGFILALLKWIDIDLLPHYKPPSTGVALFIMILFTAFAGYGTSIILRDRFNTGQSYFFLMFLFMIVFSFSFAYIRNYLIDGVLYAERADFGNKAFAIGWLLYWLLNTFLFCYSVWFKDKNIIWVLLTSVFRPSYWAGFSSMLIHMIGLPVLLNMFNAGGGMFI